MVLPNALVLCGDGINCDRETAWALGLAGFNASRAHVGDLLENPSMLSEAKLLALPGGFSFGDEIASGKILALKIRERLSDLLHRFVDDGNLVLGICNGFQVLVQMGFLPFSEPGAPRVVSLAKNGGGRFVNRWVELAVDRNVACHFFDSLDNIQLPIRHGEGRLTLGPEAEAATVEAVKQRAPLRYDSDVNASFDKIAALSNASGNVLGLMPHPEAFVRWTQHPNWNRESRLPDKEKRTSKGAPAKEAPPHGLTILRNAARMAGAQQ